MAPILDAIKGFFETERGEPEDYEVEEYVLQRRNPDPNPRVASYEAELSPEEILEREDLPSGDYVFQEMKHTGSVGDVLWEEHLEFD